MMQALQQRVDVLSPLAEEVESAGLHQLAGMGGQLDEAQVAGDALEGMRLLSQFVPVVALARHAHPDWPLVAIGNRDEFHARPAAALYAWPEGEILAGRKRYEFTIAPGARTSTGDTEGEIVERSAVPVLDRTGVEAVLAAFHGVQSQVPPMYSALKRDGRPLYELARAGVEVERAAREITIHALSLRGLHAGAIELDVECSKGTYVRTLAEDLARALGTVGHVSRLHRVWVEPFRNAPMLPLEAVLEAAQAGVPPPLLPLDQGIPGWSGVSLS